MARGSKRQINFVLAGDSKGLQRTFTQATRASDKFARDTEHHHKRASSSFASMGKSALKGAAGITAAYVSISQAKHAVSATQDLAKVTAGLHRNLGLTIEQASRWGAVAKARDIDGKALTMSFTALSKQIEGAGAGSEKAQKLFKTLGISTADLKKTHGDFNAQLALVADGFGKLEGGTKRQAAAQQLLGRGYQSVLPLFTQGTKSLKEQLHWADQYGVTLNKKTLEPVTKLTAAQRELKVANLGLQVSFTRAVAPALLKVEAAGLKVLEVMNDPRLTGEQKWEKIGKIIGPMADQLSKGLLDAIPKIANRVGEQAPKVASAFVDGFKGANSWGKLAIGAFLLTKFGGWRAFTSLGAKGASKFWAGFGATKAASLVPGMGGGKGAGALAGVRGQTPATPMYVLNVNERGGGGLPGKAGAGVGAGVAGRGALAAAGVTGVGFTATTLGTIYVDDFLKKIKQIKISDPVLSRFRDIGAIIYEWGTPVGLFNKGIRHGWDLADTLGDKLAGAGRKIPVIGDAFGTVKSAPATKKLSTDAANAIKPLADARNTLARAQNSERRSLGALTVAYAKHRDELNLLKHPTKNMEKAFRGLGDAEKDVRKEQSKLGHYKNLAETVTNLRARMRGLKKGSDEYKETAEVLRKKQKQLNDRIDDAAPATRKAGRGMARLLDNAHNLSGGYREVGKTVTSVTDDVLKGLGAKPIKWNVSKSSGNAAHPEARAMGGWIGAPGQRGHDDVPAMLGAGEAVLNRHQQGPVEAALQMTYGMGLQDLFARETKPHYFARGGMVRVPGDPDTTGGRDKVNPSIVGQVAAYIRKYDAQIGYAYDPGGGHKSPGHNITGTATDLVPRDGKWTGLFEQGLRTLVAAGKTVYYGTAGIGTPLANHGRGNHAHVEWSTGGPMADLVTKIGRIKVSGLEPLRRLPQRGADVMRAAANKYIAAHIPAGDAFSPSGAIAGGGSAAANMQLGKKLLGNAGQWPALRTLWMAESGWDQHARNRSSGAYGIPQALPGSKMGKAANPPQSNPGAQIRWGLNYISGRYGSPSRALAAWRSRSPHWYTKGGFAGKRNSLFTAPTGTRSGPNTRVRGGRRRHPLSPTAGGTRPGFGAGVDFQGIVDAGRTPDEPITLLDYIGQNAALAALTEDLGDDIAAADQSVAYYEQLLAQATDPRMRAEAAGSLKGARDTRAGLTPGAADQYGQALSDIDLQERAGLMSTGDATAARAGVREAALRGDYGQLTEREKWQIMGDVKDAAQSLAESASQIAASQQALADEIGKMNAFNERIASITGSEAVRGLADLMSENLGPRVNNRARTPGSGLVGSVRAA